MSEIDRTIAAMKQPTPIPNNQPHAHDLVMDDLVIRKRLGIENYRVPLQPHNGRSQLIDAYQEVLDLAVYLRAQIEEQNNYRAVLDDLFGKLGITPDNETPEAYRMAAQQWAQKGRALGLKEWGMGK